MAAYIALPHNETPASQEPHDQYENPNNFLGLLPPPPPLDLLLFHFIELIFTHIQLRLRLTAPSAEDS